MKRWGIRGYETINRYEPCQRAVRLAYHLTPNVLYMMLWAGYFRRYATPKPKDIVPILCSKP